jgi:hypothetical protein
MVEIKQLCVGLGLFSLMAAAAVYRHRGGHPHHHDSHYGIQSYSQHPNLNITQTSLRYNQNYTERYKTLSEFQDAVKYRPPFRITVPQWKACTRLNRYRKRGNLLYIHIPKTGGTTIESHLWPNNHLLGSCHATAAQFQQCHDSSSFFEKKNNATKMIIATIRHPIDRLKSMYKYAQGGGNGHIRDKYGKFHFARKAQDLEQFVDALVFQDDVWYAPQFDFISTTPAAAKTMGDGSLLVDEILCTETLNNDWKMLLQKYPNELGDSLDPLPDHRSRVSSPTSSSSKEHHDEGSLNDRLLTKIKLLFDKDFDLWNKYCDHL